MRFSALTERLARTGQRGWAIHQEALRLRDAGADVIFLTIGDPDQAPPETLIEATVTALREHRTGYSPTIGYPALREAIAVRHARRTGRVCTADNVVVVPGAQGGVYCALQCLAGPGDEVIVPEPIYATYEGVVGASGARMVTVPLRADRGFHPDLEALSAAITPRTRVVWINSPHNPTGAVFTDNRDRGYRRAVPRPRSVAVVGRGLRGSGLCPAACQPVVAAGYGRSHRRGLQPVEIPRRSRLSPGLDHRAAIAVPSPVQLAAVHDLRQSGLHPDRRLGRARATIFPKWRRCARPIRPARCNYAVC